MYASVETSDASGGENVRVVDFRSDTISVPTPSMRRAIFEAAVGDDVYGEDPTVRKLEERTAAMFGKEAALFVPTGTMANLLAIMVHCSRRGTEAIVGENAHGFLYEQGGAAQIAGVLLSTIRNNPDGTFCLNELARKFRGFDVHEPDTVLVMVENTHNMCGGKVLPLEWLEKLATICREKGAKVHMDGARVFNAATYLNVPVSRVIISKNVHSSDLSHRLATVCPGEMEAGVVDSSGKGIAVKVSARDWTFARIVVYTNITDEEVELAIKKIRYVIKEYEKDL
ncbi:AGAP003688-PA-like protein [Anopheles sinensis]|uniref:AGAP003688-PA-like protein n=1 Tax=Anopheles sinensis TaxID=74873 RepID=A0A084WR51_ANOSI|nr:AGAP003688-PA-like protein [Anopheles sinensis]